MMRRVRTTTASSGNGQLVVGSNTNSSGNGSVSNHHRGNSDRGDRSDRGVMTRSMWIRDGCERLDRALTRSSSRSTNSNTTSTTSTSQQQQQLSIIKQIVRENPNVLTTPIICNDNDNKDAGSSPTTIPLQKAIARCCSAEIILYLAKKTPPPIVEALGPGHHQSPLLLHLVLKMPYYERRPRLAVVQPHPQVQPHPPVQLPVVAPPVVQAMDIDDTTEMEVEEAAENNENDHENEEQFILSVRRESVYLLQKFVSMYKDDLLQPVDDMYSPLMGDLPLHFAMRYNLPYDALKIIVEAQPAAAGIKNRHGKYPLDIACSRRRIPDDELLRVLQLLVHHYPRAASRSRLKKVDFLGNLLQENNGGPKSVRFLMECVYPNLRNQWLPIQTTIEKHRTLGFIYCLARLYPETLGVVQDVRDDDESHNHHHHCNGNGCNALHLLSQCSDWCVNAYKQFVTWTGVEGVMAPDLNNGELALHKVCYTYQRVEFAQCLLDVYPDSIRVADKEGNLPLHSACSQIPACRYFDDDDELPASTSTSAQHHHHHHHHHGHHNQQQQQHLVATTAVTARNTCNTANANTTPSQDLGELIRYLTECYPGALSTKDHDGYLPLHVACECGKLRVEDIEYMVQQYPQSVKVPVIRQHQEEEDLKEEEDTDTDKADGAASTGSTGEETWLPVFLAALNECSDLDVVYYLMRQYPEAIYHPNNNNNKSQQRRQEQQKVVFSQPQINKRLTSAA